MQVCSTFLVLTLVGCCPRVGGVCRVAQNVATVVGHELVISTFEELSPLIKA